MKQYNSNSMSNRRYEFHNVLDSAGEVIKAPGKRLRGKRALQRKSYPFDTLRKLNHYFLVPDLRLENSVRAQASKRNKNGHRYSVSLCKEGIIVMLKALPKFRRK